MHFSTFLIILLGIIMFYVIVTWPWLSQKTTRRGLSSQPRANAYWTTETREAAHHSGPWPPWQYTGVYRECFRFSWNCIKSFTLVHDVNWNLQLINNIDCHCDPVPVWFRMTHSVPKKQSLKVWLAKVEISHDVLCHTTEYWDNSWKRGNLSACAAGTHFNPDW